MTALIMFLPHIPSSASKHLPALFNIYSRMLFWDRERRAIERQEPVEDENMDEKSTETPVENATGWVKLSYLLESDDETVPELLHYFTFLYGLYPLNFMSYIRKPQRYLRHANFSGADDLDVENTEIRERSEPFRHVHLLHPNFFTLTIESELTDNNRWRRSEAADVVAECMALFNPVDDHGDLIRSRGPAKKAEPNSDIPDQPLSDDDATTPFQSRHNSWRKSQSTAVAQSPDGSRVSGLARKTSQTSQSLPSIADSPSLQPADQLDSPTLPPQTLVPPTNQLADMLNSQRSNKDSLYQSVTNESVASLTSSNHNQDSYHVDAYLASLTRATIPRSPSIRPATTDPSLKLAYLHREIQLLKNDLNFERYLKQQHLSHIGQLRRKQIREARVEAETQSLINSNRSLKSKLEEAKRAAVQMKKETEKSKTHSRNWESDLSAKLRVLKQEQKKWNLEKEDLKKDLQIVREDAEKLKQLVVACESRELSAKQKVASVEGSLDELEHLRIEVEKLAARVRTYEAGELKTLKAKENEAEALKRVEILEMELRARDNELMKSKQVFDEELYAVRPSGKNGNGDGARHAALSQEVIDAALASHRHRIVEIQKAHNYLLKRYTALHSAYLDLKEKLEHRNSGDDAILAGAVSGYRSNSPSPPPNGRGWKTRPHAASDPDVHECSPSLSVFRPGRLDTSYQTTTPNEGRSPVSAGGQVQHFNAPQPFSPSAASTEKGNVDSDSLDGHGKAKIKPQSDIRIYGRGKHRFFAR
jgi:solute carrier family 25 protein 16